MVKSSTHTVRCQYCDKEFNEKVVDELTSEELSSIIDLSVFKIKCPHCKEDFIYDHAVTYKDEEKGFEVKRTVIVKDFLEYIEEKEKEKSNKICRVIPEDYIRFIEKVGILTSGLDDVVAEVYKEILFINLNSDNVADIMIQFNNDCSDYKVVVMYNDDSNEFYDIDMSMFNSLYKDIKARGVIGRSNDYVVDRDFAMKILYSKEDLGPIHLDMIKEWEEE